MHKVGVVSDTHGLLRPEVAKALEGCELILHGGDINSRKILDDLAAIAPVRAVRGNNDSEWAGQIPEKIETEIFGVRIFMVHNKKYVPMFLPKTDLVIYGHSHSYVETEKDGVYYLNPGSCGPRRFHQEITMAVLWIEEDGSFRVEKVLIPHKREEAPAEEKLPGNLALLLPAMMKEIEAGKTVKQIAGKHKISEKLAEMICRMYLTHPGVDVDGIMRRLEQRM